MSVALHRREERLGLSPPLAVLLCVGFSLARKKTATDTRAPASESQTRRRPRPAFGRGLLTGFCFAWDRIEPVTKLSDRYSARLDR